MAIYVTRRFLWALFVAVLMSVIVFGFVRLIPGDPALILLGQHPDPTLARQIDHQLGLDRPVAAQYVSWAGGLLHGDFGRSLAIVGTGGLSGEPVSQTISTSLSVTLPLAGLGMAIALVFGGLSGLVSARFWRTRRDAAISLVTFVGISVPDFYLGILLILLFGLAWPVLPPTGWVAWSQSVWGAFEHLILPALALGVINGAAIARTLRASLLEVQHLEFMRAAEARGVANLVVFLRHGLRNALLPTLTVAALQMGYLVGGALVIERVFALPGMGFNLIDAVSRRDYPTIEGITLVFALLFALINLLTDLLYAAVDPTIRQRLASR